MKRAFLYSEHCPKINLQKVNQSIYYSTQNNKFYRLNIMPSCAAFVNQNTQKRLLITLTSYDPNYLIIDLLSKNKIIHESDLPSQLRYRQWTSLNLIKTPNNEYHYMKQNIFNYLQKKVDLLQNYLHQHNPLDRLKLLKLQKSISADSITLLKHQINDQLVNQFVKQRFNQVEIKKMIPMPEQDNQVFKPKPLKNIKKSTENIEKPKNQPTLFSSWTKKKQ